MIMRMNELLRSKVLPIVLVVHLVSMLLHQSAKQPPQSLIIRDRTKLQFIDIPHCTHECLRESTQQIIPGVILQCKQFLIRLDHIARCQFHPGKLTLHQEYQRVQPTLQVIPSREGKFGIGSTTTKSQRTIELIPEFLRNVLAIPHVWDTELEISQVDLVFMFPLSDQEVAWLDVPVDDLVPMEVFHPVHHLQSGHQDSLEGQSPSASHSQSLQIIPQLLNDEIGPTALLKSLLDLRKTMQVRLFQSLVGLYLVLEQPLLLVGVALEEEEHSILTGALLDHLVSAVLNRLQWLVLALYHHISDRVTPYTDRNPLYTHTHTYTMHDPARIYLLMGKFASGKTTLIRRILTQQTQQKYAIIQNEFAQGQMGIQQPLIMDQTGTPFSSFLELPNGCICCSAKNDLVAAVEYIVSNTPVRRIVVQTNGLADPAAAIKQFWFDQQMNINAELHSVITMVSARKWDTYSGEEIFLKQCAFATHLLVSFVDVQGEERYKVIRGELEGMNCESSIERSDQADLIKLLHGESLFNQDILNDLQGKHHPHLHPHSIRPLFIKGTCTAQTKAELEQHVGGLLWESGIKILRIKGVFCLKDHHFVFELQGVQDLFEIKETKTTPSVYNGESRVLIIGQALPSKEIQTTLHIL